MEQRKVFDEYIRSTGLKGTTQRALVLDAFLATDEHVSVDDIYRLLRRKDCKVGYATIYRTMKLISESGLAREVMLGDGISRFEHTFGRKHHHHLVCTRCRKIIEFTSETMDRGEREIIEKYGFVQHSHRFEIFGLCDECQREENNVEPLD